MLRDKTERERERARERERIREGEKRANKKRIVEYPGINLSRSVDKFSKDALAETHGIVSAGGALVLNLHQASVR